MPETATHPSFAGLVNITTEQLSDNTDLATARTIEAMSAYTRADAGSKEVAAAVREAVLPILLAHAPMAGLQVIFRWIQRRVRFQQDAATAQAVSPAPADPLGVELLIRPVDLLRMHPATGDCDDFAMLTAAMLLASGYGAELVTIAADPRQPEAWSHVYAQAVMADGARIPMDTSHGKTPGWEYSQATRRKVWPIAPPRSTMHGIGFIQAPQGNASSPTVNTPGPSWVDAIATGGMRILEKRYGQAPEGTYYQGADGSMYMRQQKGDAPLQFPSGGVGIGVSTTSLILMAIAGLVVVSVLKGNN